MSFPAENSLLEVIVAEDEPITRKRLVAVIEGLGHPVRAFSNGLEAWRAFEEKPARVIISDWLMPDMDGTELCRKVRDRPNTEYTYFILVTAERTEERDYEAAINEGTDDFLTKPISREAIWRRLRVAKRILGFTKQIRQLEALIPICSYCKQVRDDEHYWKSIEDYIHIHTGSSFTHGICPTCFERVMQEFRNRPVVPAP
jgi:CheY-like chemotaxis protein